MLMVNTLQSAAQTLHRAAGILNARAAWGSEHPYHPLSFLGDCQPHLQILLVFLTKLLNGFSRRMQALLSGMLAFLQGGYGSIKGCKRSFSDIVEAATLDSEEVVLTSTCRLALTGPCHTFMGEKAAAALAMQRKH